MEARKKSPGFAEFTVVLEEIRAQFNVFGESLAGFREETTKRFETVDGELTFLKAEVGAVRAESRAGLHDLSSELRAGLHDVRSELRAGLHDVRSELRALRSEVRDVRADLDEVRAGS